MLYRLHVSHWCPLPLAGEGNQNAPSVRSPIRPSTHVAFMLQAVPCPCYVDSVAAISRAPVIATRSLTRTFRLMPRCPPLR
jgi:hypothetical protein